MRDLREANPVGLLTLATVGILTLLVAGVGLVGLWARYVNTWRSLFLLERVAEVTAPVAMALATAAILVGGGLIVHLRYTETGGR